MSMFTITGQIINTFNQPGRVDKSTGEQLPDTPKVQLLGNIPLSDGSSKSDLVTLTIPEGLDLKSHQGKHVTLPLGVMAADKNSIIYYIPKGSQLVPNRSPASAAHNT